MFALLFEIVACIDHGKVLVYFTLVTQANVNVLGVLPIGVLC